MTQHGEHYASEYIDPWTGETKMVFEPPKSIRKLQKGDWDTKL